MKSKVAGRKLKSKAEKEMRTVLRGSRIRKKRPAIDANPGLTYIPASEAKSKFATVLDDVSKGQEVFITKHNAPKAVVISVEKFNSLSAAASSLLNTLASEFDARLARMQTASAQSAMRNAFNASPDKLGKAALNAARSRS